MYVRFVLIVHVLLLVHVIKFHVLVRLLFCSLLLLTSIVLLTGSGFDCFQVFLVKLLVHLYSPHGPPFFLSFV